MISASCEHRYGTVFQRKSISCGDIQIHIFHCHTERMPECNVMTLEYYLFEKTFPSQIAISPHKI